MNLLEGLCGGCKLLLGDFYFCKYEQGRQKKWEFCLAI